MGGEVTVRLLWVAASFAGVLAVAGFTGAQLSTRGEPQAVMVAHGLLFVAGLIAWVATMQAPAAHPLRRHTGWLLLAAALVARSLLLPFPPSDDFNRYLWEGRLVLAGESPYAQPAADAAEAWRDAVWAAMNHRDRLTAYPPLAELIFAVGVGIAYATWPLKLVFIAAEMGTLVLLREELRRRCLPEANLAIAAFSPVLLLATAGEAHFDALFVLATLLALRARARGRPGWAWIWLGVAIEIKVVAVLLAPLLIRRGGWRWLWLLVPVLVLPALPFADSLPNLGKGLFAFGTTTFHNGLIPGLLRPLFGGEASVAAAVSWSLLGLWSVLVGWRIDDPFRGGFLILGGLLVFSPITHFWYFGWIVPFLVLIPQPAWLLLSGLQAFYFTAWSEEAGGRGWFQPDWAWWAQWLPFSVVLLGTGLPGARRLLSWRRIAPSWPAPHNVSVIMPVYNEGERITAAVAGLRRDQPGVTEIIVVDGGSSDWTPAAAAAAGVQVLSGPRGRGQQIAAGIAAARGDVIWIVHADVVPPAGSAGAILGALSADPAAAGGAIGQCYARVSPLLLTVEGLNVARSALFGISFGDQGQFVRRAALPRLGGFPAQPLMEDVELSLRLRRVGPVLHLGVNGRVSTRRWDVGSGLGRVALVLRLTFVYLCSRRRQELADALYRAYYPMNQK